MSEASSHATKGAPVDWAGRPCQCSFCLKGQQSLCVRLLLEAHTDEDR